MDLLKLVTDNSSVEHFRKFKRVLPYLSIAELHSILQNRHWSRILMTLIRDKSGLTSVMSTFSPHISDPLIFSTLLSIVSQLTLDRIPDGSTSTFISLVKLTSSSLTRERIEFWLGDIELIFDTTLGLDFLPRFQLACSLFEILAGNSRIRVRMASFSHFLISAGTFMSKRYFPSEQLRAAPVFGEYLLTTAIIPSTQEAVLTEFRMKVFDRGRREFIGALVIAIAVFGADLCGEIIRISGLFDSDDLISTFMVLQSVVKIGNWAKVRLNEIIEKLGKYPGVCGLIGVIINGMTVIEAVDWIVKLINGHGIETGQEIMKIVERKVEIQNVLKEKVGVEIAGKLWLAQIEEEEEEEMI
jgi:hypothetical protein